MHVVGATQLDCASERSTERRTLNHDHRHDEPDEREPRERGKHKAERKERKRNERKRAGNPRSDESPGRRPRTLRD